MDGEKRKSETNRVFEKVNKWRSDRGAKNLLVGRGNILPPEAGLVSLTAIFALRANKIQNKNECFSKLSPDLKLDQLVDRSYQRGVTLRDAHSTHD